MLLGAELVTATVDRIAAGDCTPAEQMHFDESRLHPAPKIFKEDCRIDWRQPGERIVNLVRGLSPYPAAWTPIFKKGEPSDTAKIFAVHFEPGGVVQRPGTVETDKRTYLAVACADGRIVVDELQIAGKRRMSARDLLPGMRDLSDYSFGEEAAEAVTPAAVTVYGPYRRNTDHGTDRRLREAQQSVGQWRQVGGTFRDDQYDDKRDRSHFAVVRHLEHHANHLFQYDGDDHSCRRKAEIHQIDIGHDRTDEGAQHPQPPLLNGVSDIGLLLHDDRRDTGQHRPRQARRFMEMRRNRKTEQVGERDGDGFRNHFERLHAAQYLPRCNHLSRPHGKKCTGKFLSVPKSAPNPEKPPLTVSGTECRSLKKLPKTNLFIKPSVETNAVRAIPRREKVHECAPFH